MDGPNPAPPKKQWGAICWYLRWGIDSFRFLNGGASPGFRNHPMDFRVLGLDHFSTKRFACGSFGVEVAQVPPLRRSSNSTAQAACLRSCASRASVCAPGAGPKGERSRGSGRSESSGQLWIARGSTGPWLATTLFFLSEKREKTQNV